jgi:amino acid transporter
MKQINPTTRTPVYAVLFVAFGSGLLGLLSLNEQAGLALFSVAVIGLYVSYALPIVCRCLPAGQRAMKTKEVSLMIRRSSRAIVTDLTTLQGPFSLGRAALPLGLVSIAWVASLQACCEPCSLALRRLTSLLGADLHRHHPPLPLQRQSRCARHELRRRNPCVHPW